MKFKALLATVLLGAAGIANAAIEVPSFNGTNNASGSELVLTVFDGLNTYSRDLGIGFNSAGSIADGTTFAADTELTNFITNAAGALSWAVFGADNAAAADPTTSNDVTLWGLRFAGTSQAGGLFSDNGLGTNTLGGAAQATEGYVAALNNLPEHVGSGTVAADILLNGTSVVDSGAAAYQNNFQGQPIEGTFGALGSSLDFFLYSQTGTVAPINPAFPILGNSFTAEGVATILAGAFTLDQAGNLSFGAGTTVIPVPAAVWLFGSALIGLVGAGRRKAA